MNIKTLTPERNLLSRFWSRSKLSNINVDKFKNYIGGNSNNLSIRRIHELNQLKTGISNFVRIISKKNIPVNFATDTEASYTDFKSVTISADIQENNFDIICGLAMHEGSHIRYTNRKYMMDLFNLSGDSGFNKSVKQFDDIMGVYKNIMDSKTEDLIIEKKYMPYKDSDGEYVIFSDNDKEFYGSIMKFLISWVKDLANWIEDRRIDKIVYTNSPGYKGYYTALYNYYFLNDIISTGIKSDEYRDEELTSYMFRIINSINDETDDTALDGLSKIIKTIDIDTIERLNSIRDSFQLSSKIFKIVLNHINDMDRKKVEEQMQEQHINGGKGKGDEEGEDSEGEGEDSEGEGEDSSIDYDKLDLSDIKLGNGDKGKELDLNKLNKKQMSDLKDAIKDQIDLIGDKIKKESLNKSDIENIDALNNKSLDIVSVNTSNGKGINELEPIKRSIWDDDNKYDGEVYDVVVLNNVSTNTFFNNNLFPFSSLTAQFNNEVQSGIRAGKKLGNKLLVRNDERTTKYSRKPYGNIDKRLLSDLGFGGESIFTQTIMETYTNSILHISIDASGSMDGIKLGKCIQLATTICIAADMIDNLEVVISMRGTRMYDPCIAVIYDSRVDSIKKIKKLFPYLDTSGTTPEGLCFAAIQEQIEKTSGTLKSYFINLSDGEPYFDNYSGQKARVHTRHEVHNMTLKNVKILSYFINGSWGNEVNFREMYGKYASFIDVNNIGQISKTLNKLFLEK